MASRSQSITQLVVVCRASLDRKDPGLDFAHSSMSGGAAAAIVVMAAATAGDAVQQRALLVGLTQALRSDHSKACFLALVVPVPGLENPAG